MRKLFWMPAFVAFIHGHCLEPAAEIALLGVVFELWQCIEQMQKDVLDQIAGIVVVQSSAAGAHQQKGGVQCHESVPRTIVGSHANA